MTSVDLLRRTLIILVMFSPWCSGDLISSTCDQTPNVLLCITTLKQDPRSRKADVPGLSLIMIDAVKAKANSTMEQIHKMGLSSSVIRNALMECTENYNVILKSDIPRAVRFLKENILRLAENAMADSAVEAQGCESSLSSSSEKLFSPLMEMNRSVRELSKIAQSIIRVRLNKYGM